jgi:hypothetical protein
VAFYLEEKNMSKVSKEDIIAAIKECAGKMGRAPKYAELLNHFPPAKMGAIRKYLGTYTLALHESGLDCLGAGFEVAMDELFRDWALIVRKMKKLPTMTEYEHQSRYSVRPLVGRFKRWAQMPRGMHEYARQQKLDVEYADVMNIIREHYRGEPESAWMLERAVDLKACGAYELPDRPVLGPPLTTMHMSCGPTNEQGVMFLFALLAKDLGFVVELIRTEYPDCQALRQVGLERWQRVWIEFEYESRNFLKHFHDASKADIIVCWSHNWPECPLPVIELKELVKRLV